jgi:transcription initiation factor TFIID subunit 6
MSTDGGAVVIPEKTHPLSEELWAYYKRVVRTAMDPASVEREKRAVFASLGGDPGLHELVPYLSLHIHNTVTAAVGPQGRGALDPLWAAMRLFRCMVANPHMHLELYLHQMLPSVMTVIANNRLASGVGGGLGGGDHYALRAFAAQTLAMLVKKYAPVYRPLASVICKTFAERAEEFLRECEGEGSSSSNKAAVATLYGAVIGIRHLGSRCVLGFLFLFLSKPRLTHTTNTNTITAPSSSSSSP